MAKFKSVRSKILTYIGFAAFSFIVIIAVVAANRFHFSPPYVVAALLLLTLILILTASQVHFKFIKVSLKKILDGISELESGNFGFRIKIDQSDELGRLAERINRLGARLEQMRNELVKHHEKEMERADRMASLGELAASIAHEIKNPMAGISNAMQVLKQELAPDDEKEEIYTEIIRQTHRVNRAVNDLLSYARPTPPELLQGSINDPINRALVLLDGQIKEKLIGIEYKLQSDPPMLMLDSQQIQQVFVNLIMNGIQAMEQRGKLVIETMTEDEYFCACIADNGVGIPENVLKNIFKPFFTTKHKGTGLGLSICRSIVENHNGKIEVESKVNVGTRFKVLLPKFEKHTGAQI